MSQSEEYTSCKYIPKLKNDWLEKQKLRNNILWKARAKFCNFKCKRKSVPMSFDQIGILNYYLDMERNSARIILETAITIRKVLANEIGITRIVDSGISNKLVKFLDDDEIAKHFHIVSSGQEPKNSQEMELITTEYIDELRYEVIWSLTNMSSSAHTDYVISLNCLGNIKKILENRDSSTKLLEQCVWALGNISGDSKRSRDLVLNEDFLPIIIRLLNEKKELSFLRIATWCLSNMLRGKPRVPIESVKIALTTLIDLIRSCYDEEVLITACEAISYAIDRPLHEYRAAEYFINAGATDTIISLINEKAIQPYALCVIGNLIASGTEENTDQVLEAGILDVISKLLSSDPDISIRKECVWILANIAVENENNKRKLFDTGLIQKTIEIINDPNTNDTIKKEAYRTIRNICDCSDEEVLKYLFDCDIVTLFKKGLDGESESSSYCLEGLALLEKSKERTLEAMNKYELVDIIKSGSPED